MKLTELQEVYRKADSVKKATADQVARLELDLEHTKDEADNLYRNWQSAELLGRKRAGQLYQLREQQRLMVEFITTTRPFQEFIIERTWKQDASDLEMVMAFLASLPEVK